MNSESEAIWRLIRGILEDKRGVTVVDEVVGDHVWEFQFGSAPGPNASSDLEHELSALLESEPITPGCKAYLQGKFMAVVNFGFDTETTIALSGIMVALEAENKEDYETETFLEEVRAMIYPEAHDVAGLLRWGKDIQSSYFGEARKARVSIACDYLERLTFET